MKRDLVSLALWTTEDLLRVFAVTRALRTDSGGLKRPLERKTIALVFERASLRTRVSFEVGIAQLGGHPVFLHQEAIGMATRESVHDIGVILSQYCELIVARTVRHQTCVQLAESATVPVINALTDLVHPCQLLADVYTLMEQGRFTHRTKVVFVGGGSTMANSWLECATKFPFQFVCSCPPGFEPHPRLLEDAQSAGVSTIQIVTDPVAAVVDADVVYTDVWPQAGAGMEEGERFALFRDYQVNPVLLRHARPDCLVLHRLPANRGEEITSDVLDGPQSAVLQQARNRLHVQKGILSCLLEGV